MVATLEGALNHFIANCPLVVSVHHLMTKWRIQLKGGYALDFYFNATSLVTLDKEQLERVKKVVPVRRP